MNISYTSAAYNAAGTIDMEVEHPVFGTIPFTASPDDTEEHGRLLFEDAKDTATPYAET